MKKISFLYLDVGGVAIIDFSGTQKMKDFFASLGVTAQNHDAVMKVWEKHQAKICTTFDADDILPEFCELGLVFPENFSLTQAFVEAFDANKSIWKPVIEAKKSGVQLGLLTNMYQGMFDLIVKQKLIDPNLFEVIVDSSICGFKKPDAAIYTVAEQKTGCPPEEILFVDNTPVNLEAAQKRGWQTMLYDPIAESESSQKLSELLKR